MTRDTLDDLLDRSALATRADLAAGDVRAMIGDARREAIPKRRASRLAIGTAVAALLIGGAGVAVANDLLWSGWVTEPTATYSFTVPSGATCTVLTGDVESSDPAVAQAVKAFYAGDVMGSADVAAGLAELRADPPIATLPDGSTEVLVPGSAHYDEDAEYKWAVSNAVGDALEAHLHDLGFSQPAHVALGEQLCSNDEPAGDR